MCGRYGRRADKQRIAEWFHTHNTDVFNDEYYEIGSSRLAPSYNRFGGCPLVESLFALKYLRVHSKGENDESVRSASFGVSSFPPLWF